MPEFSKRHDSKMLIIMRHAEADWGLDDFNRPLTQRGHGQASEAGQWLQETGAIPEMIISSAALRTRQTTTWIEDALGEKAPTASLDERLYNAPSSALIGAINHAPSAVNSLMLVAPQARFCFVSDDTASAIGLPKADGLLRKDAIDHLVTRIADWFGPHDAGADA